MTCREKLAKEWPRVSAEMNCPHDFKYAKPPVYCPYGCKASGKLSRSEKDDLCANCWNREIPEDNTKDEQEIKPNLEDMCKEFVHCRGILMYGGFTSKEAADILQRLAYAFSMNEFGVDNLSLGMVIDILKENKK